MVVLFNTLLLSSDGRNLLDWVGIFIILWLPQLIVVAVEALLLFGIMLGLRRHWIKWVLMGAPYVIVYLAIVNALEHQAWDYTRNTSLDVILNDSDLWARFAPTMLSFPFLVILHIVLIVSALWLNPRKI